MTGRKGKKKKRLCSPKFPGLPFSAHLPTTAAFPHSVVKPMQEVKVEAIGDGTFRREQMGQASHSSSGPFSLTQ